jgi:hypothetical protein
VERAADIEPDSGNEIFWWLQANQVCPGAFSEGKKKNPGELN